MKIKSGLYYNREPLENIYFVHEMNRTDIHTKLLPDLDLTGEGAGFSGACDIPEEPYGHIC